MDTEKRKKIVIIEDDEHISKVYEIKLAKENVDVKVFRDGPSGFAGIAIEIPDLILLDLMIPGRDGFWVIEEVKKKPELANIPIIALSNLGQQTDRDRAMGLGAVDYLIKVDYSIGEVISKVKQYLEKNGGKGSNGNTERQ
ncbi:MAG: response regulator [bacterium]|nr:response regulator [bacterium]